MGYTALQAGLIIVPALVVAAVGGDRGRPTQ
jgi:hypothetical protein